MSELPPGTPPRPPYFPLRNRLISALAEAVVVVEARVRSGSLTTARHAAEQGVDVCAVPGPVGRPGSEGPHALLRDGALLVRGAADVLELLGLAPGAERRAAPSPAPPTDPLARRVLAEIERAPRATDLLARTLSLAPGDLLAVLSTLELDARIRRDRDGSWVAASSAGGERL